MKQAWKIAGFLMIAAAAAFASEPVRVDGSSSVYPITQAAAEAFTATTGIPVEVEFTGTRAGFRRFVRGEIDIQDASRPILADEIEVARGNAVSFVEVPIAYDALAVVVHPSNTWAEDIKVSELKRLWSAEAQGEETKWSDLRAGWPEERIVLFGAGADSGTLDYFGEVIAGKAGGLRSDYFGSEDDDVIVRGVANTQNALGFLPFAYLEKNPYALKPLAVAWDVDPRTGKETGGGPVAPSNRALLQGYYIPLGRPLFVYVNKRSLEEKPQVGEFVKYLLSEGRKHIREAGYLVLNEPAYRHALRLVEAKETGTRFGGTIPVGVAIHDILTLELKDHPPQP